MPSFIDDGPAVSELSGLENVDTTWTDRRMDIWPILQQTLGETTKNHNLA